MECPSQKLFGRQPGASFLQTGDSPTSRRVPIRPTSQCSLDGVGEGVPCCDGHPHPALRAVVHVHLLLRTLAPVARPQPVHAAPSVHRDNDPALPARGGLGTGSQSACGYPQSLSASPLPGAGCFKVVFFCASVLSAVQKSEGRGTLSPRCLLPEEGGGEAPPPTLGSPLPLRLNSRVELQVGSGTSHPRRVRGGGGGSMGSGWWRIRHRAVQNGPPPKGELTHRGVRKSPLTAPLWTHHRHELPPHVFALGEETYRSMLQVRAGSRGWVRPMDCSSGDGYKMGVQPGRGRSEYLEDA